MELAVGVDAGGTASTPFMEVAGMSAAGTASPSPTEPVSVGRAASSAPTELVGAGSAAPASSMEPAGVGSAASASSMELVVGVDAGGTASTALVATTGGVVVGRGRSGPGNPLTAGAGKCIRDRPWASPGRPPRHSSPRPCRLSA